MTSARATSAHVFPETIPGVLPGRFRGMATKVIYYSMVATVFVFVSILLTGIHP
jgi:hypothetical protein